MFPAIVLELCLSAEKNTAVLYVALSIGKEALRKKGQKQS